MTRRAWRFVIAGYALMAAGFLVLGFALQHEVHELDKTQAELRETQTANDHAQNAIGTFVVHASGAICEVALAGDEGRIIRSYLSGDFEIDHYFGPECQEVAQRAIDDIFTRNGRPIPPNLERGVIDERNP